ncbi:MAG: ABC transporter permease [Deltaproteobacteria bacterium]|nr:ABC transporter permease [Deltaproteobacteria bacterium]
MPLTLQLIFRPLFSKRKALIGSLAWIVILGLVLGVLAQSTAVSILSGFEKVFQQSILAFNAHLVLMKDSELSENGVVFKDLEKLKEASQIKSIAPFIYREALLAYHSKIKGVAIKGTPIQSLSGVYSLQISLLPNAMSVSELEKNERIVPVLLGKALFEELKINPQDPVISLLSPKADLENISSSKNFERFKVIGTFSSGLYEFDSHFVFLSLANAQQFYGLAGLVSGFEMQLNDFKQAKSLAIQLKEKLGLGYEAVSWDVLNADIFDSLKTEKGMFFLMMGLIVLIASFNLVGLVAVLFSEQKHDFATLSVLGLSALRLKFLVVAQCFFLSLTGVSFGLLLSATLAFALNHFHWIRLAQEVYLISELPLEFKPTYALAVLLYALALSLIMSLAASLRTNTQEVLFRK